KQDGVAWNGELERAGHLVERVTAAVAVRSVDVDDLKRLVADKPAGQGADRRAAQRAGGVGRLAGDGPQRPRAARWRAGIARDGEADRLVVAGDRLLDVGLARGRDDREQLRADESLDQRLAGGAGAIPHRDRPRLALLLVRDLEYIAEDRDEQHRQDDQ